MNIKIIKTETEYEGALARIDALMDANPGSPQEEELELLVLLVEKYEAEHYPIDPPDPVEAIKFRMEQEGLQPKDLIPYLGSQSKVSEVLNYKRPLSLSMIRNLEAGLGIPAEILIQKPVRKGTIPRTPESNKLSQANIYFNCSHLAQEHKLNFLWNWQSDIIEKAIKQQLPPFDQEKLDRTIFKELSQLSSYSAGPQMACELLNKKGIHLIVQKISSETELDGGCFFTPKQRPVIGLTLRNNRLADFWFTLFHLLAHLYLNRGERTRTYFDSIECIFDKAAPVEEREVNKLLKEVLYPSPVSKTVIRSYLRTRNQHSPQKVFQTFDTSPEIICNLLWLEEENVEEEITIFSPKKVNEKLEVSD